MEGGLRALQAGDPPQIRTQSQKEAAVILFLCIFIPLAVLAFIYWFYKPIRRCLERVRVKVQMREWKHHLVDGFSTSDALDAIDDDDLNDLSGGGAGRSAHSTGEVEISLYSTSRSTRS